MLLVRTEGVIRFFTFDRKENEFDDSRSRVRDICSSQDIIPIKEDISDGILITKLRESIANATSAEELNIEWSKLLKDCGLVLDTFDVSIDEYHHLLDKKLRFEQLAQSVVVARHTSQDLNEEEYDVFVSHAWEDKEDFVDEFVEELKKQGLKVWYDTNKLKWGDSMREKIDKGLAKSRYGVVVLSPNYIAEHKYWTKAELDGLFQVESINGKTILPIWHNLTKKQVVEYSPIIANRKAMTTASMTAEEIAAELKELFVPESAEEN